MRSKILKYLFHYTDVPLSYRTCKMCQNNGRIPYGYLLLSLQNFDYNFILVGSSLHLFHGYLRSIDNPQMTSNSKK